MSVLNLGIALLASLLTIPAFAAEPNRDTATLEARLAAMQKQIDATKAQLDQLQRTLDRVLAQVREQRNYQDVRDQLSTTQLELQKNRAELRQLRDQLAQVRGSATAPAGGLASGTVAQPYVAGASPDGTAAGAATAAKATVRLINEYPFDSVYYLNGRRYVVPPYRTINLEFTPGDLTYSVEQWKPTPTRIVLRPGDDRPIRVYLLR